MTSLSEITASVITRVLWQGLEVHKPHTNQPQQLGVSVSGWLVKALGLVSLCKYS